MDWRSEKPSEIPAESKSEKFAVAFSNKYKNHSGEKEPALHNVKLTSGWLLLFGVAVILNLIVFISALVITYINFFPDPNGFTYLGLLIPFFILCIISVIYTVIVAMAYKNMHMDDKAVERFIFKAFMILLLLYVGIVLLFFATALRVR